MKKILFRLLCTALCLCYSASLCTACVVGTADISLSASAHTERPAIDVLIKDALLREEETIDLTVYCMKESDLHTIYSTLYATDPSLFYVAAEYSISTGADGYVDYLRPVYRMAGEARVRATEDFTRRINSIVAPLRTLTPLEQVAYLHDYMILRFTYDTSHTVYDAYTLLTSGSGVCQAYALLFTALAQALEIPAACVTCFDRAHEWNMVYLNDAWYHIDLVWDDTDHDGEVLHTYFLLGDAELRARRAAQEDAWNTTYTWDAPAPSASTPTGEILWRNLSGPFSFPADGTVTFTYGGVSYHVDATLACTPLSKP